MTYFLVLLLGIVVSGIVAYVALHGQRAAIRKHKQELDGEADTPTTLNDFQQALLAICEVVRRQR